MIERSLTLYDYTLHFPNHALMGKYRQPRRFILYLIDMLCLAVERPTQGPGALLVVGQITNWHFFVAKGDFQIEVADLAWLQKRRNTWHCTSLTCLGALNREFLTRVQTNNTVWELFIKDDFLFTGIIAFEFDYLLPYMSRWHHVTAQMSNCYIFWGAEEYHPIVPLHECLSSNWQRCALQILRQCGSLEGCFLEWITTHAGIRASPLIWRPFQCSLPHYLARHTLFHRAAHNRHLSSLWLQPVWWEGSLFGRERRRGEVFPRYRQPRV